MKYSFIIPVYNRPDHIEALLKCLVKQTFKDFEVIVVESGSSIKSDLVSKSFESDLDIHYFYKGNDGQGYSRNYGMQRAKGAYFLILDSDVVLDSDYVQNIDAYLATNDADCFGGPDKLHPKSTATQKAVNYLMTSFFTTGGTRGGKVQIGKFQPRSFNMGMKKEVFEKTKGYYLPFLGEDLEFSRRILDQGFKTGFIPDAYVYHERKSSLINFYKQLHWFGRSRINLFRLFPDTLKVVHFIPLVFMIGLVSALIGFFTFTWVGLAIYALVKLYFILILIDSTIKNKSIKVGFISSVGVVFLMSAYSFGMISEWIKPTKLNIIER